MYISPWPFFGLSAKRKGLRSIAIALAPTLNSPPLVR